MKLNSMNTKGVSLNPEYQFKCTDNEYEGYDVVIYFDPDQHEWLCMSGKIEFVMKLHEAMVYVRRAFDEGILQYKKSPYFSNNKFFGE